MTQNSKSAICQHPEARAERLESIKNIVVILILILSFQGCSTFGYVAKQGAFQAELLAGREKITNALQRPGMPPEYYRKMALILDVRRFAKQYLSLYVDGIYSTINFHWHRQIFNVSAVYPFQFKAYRWKFPIIGSVPYMGYFDSADASAEARRLRSFGYDVLERRAGGYSTLGYFNDPVWPAMLHYPDFKLIELLFHELAHATLFFKGNIEFNENFATFVGRVGLLQYLRHRDGENSAQSQEALAYYDDEAIQNSWMLQLYETLDDLYKSKLSAKQKQFNKRKIIWRSIMAYRNLPFKTGYFGGQTWRDLNNARIMSFKRYNFEQDTLTESFKQSGSSWAAWFDKLRREGPGELAN